MNREAIILTIRVEAADGAPLPEVWPEAREMLLALPPNSTRIELLEARED